MIAGFQLSKVKLDHRAELGRVAADLQDEHTSRSDVDLQLNELRKEVRLMSAFLYLIVAGLHVFSLCV